MNDTEQRHDTTDHQLEILRLLDERFRLREDPERQEDLKDTHVRLREKLREARDSDSE